MAAYRRRVPAAEVMDVHCRLCPGLIDRVPLAQAGLVAGEHFARWHPGVSPVDGVHTSVLPAARVCDACLVVVELPWWLHVSTPRTPAAGHEDADGRWLLCQSCHDLWAGADLLGWIRRAWAVAIDRAPWLAREPAAVRAGARGHLADTLRPLLQRLDPGRQVTVAQLP